MADPPRPPGLPPGALKAIRASLCISVATLAAAALVMRRAEPPPAALPAAAVVAAIAGIFTLFVLRERSARAPREQALQVVVIAWAVGEGAALLGWVSHLLGGPLMWAIPGTLTFLAALIGVPIPGEQE